MLIALMEIKFVKITNVSLKGGKIQLNNYQNQKVLKNLFRINQKIQELPTQKTLNYQSPVDQIDPFQETQKNQFQIKKIQELQTQKILNCQSRIDQIDLFQKIQKKLNQTDQIALFLKIQKILYQKSLKNLYQDQFESTH